MALLNDLEGGIPLASLVPRFPPDTHVPPGNNAPLGRSSLDEFDAHHLVTWDGENDRRNPKNWPAWRRWSLVVFLSLMAFGVSLGSTMMIPAVTKILDDAKFGVPREGMPTFVVSVYLLGFAIGPLFAAPISEVYGRSFVYGASILLYMFATVFCAIAPNVEGLVTFRFFAGFFGSVPLTLGASSIGDVMRTDSPHTGKAMALWSTGSLVGPTVAPVIGGFICESADWRSMFWFHAAVMIAISLIFTCFLSETYGPVLLERKASKLRGRTGDKAYFVLGRRHKSGRNMVKNEFFRPLKLLFTSPLLLILSFAVAVIFGFHQMIATTLAWIYQIRYEMRTGLSGLTYLGDGLGIILGALAVPAASDRYIAHKKKQNKPIKPEHRLWLIVPGTILTAVGLFWYGWAVQKDAHFLVPISGLVFFGFGVMAVLQSAAVYLVEAFPVHSASVLAGSYFLRSLFGALLPLGWGNSLLGIVALMMLPGLTILVKLAEGMRHRTNAA
ncbi:polyamine transporter 1 [Cercophora newfieldiana]|uniref:Polyamine transporter 1 n=1 Tax=Cercophora newfieldiana TaxID=92897 RepID=A0AA39YUX2_9PEZI|nr:polyamine transporter 1 [Cercophora newfieldiana]